PAVLAGGLQRLAKGPALGDVVEIGKQQPQGLVDQLLLLETQQLQQQGIDGDDKAVAVDGDNAQLAALQIGLEDLVPAATGSLARLGVGGVASGGAVRRQESTPGRAIPADR